MGLFDFLKKNKKNEILEPQEKTTSTIKHSGKSLNEIYAEKLNIVTPKNQDEIFDFIKIYAEYIVRFIGMQTQNNYSPIAAYEKNDGEIVGYLYIAKDPSYNALIKDVVRDMEIEFEKRLSEKKIKSYIIFFHSQFSNDDNHSIAHNSGEFSAISVQYKTSNNLFGFIGLPYFFKEDEIMYAGFPNFSKEQNNFILNTQLKEGKEYFQELIYIDSPIIENEIGLKIKKVNNGKVGDMWAGIFGFDRLHEEGGQNFLIHNAALVFIQDTVKSNDEVLISEMSFDNIVFRGVKTIDDETRTTYPLLKTDIFIDVENKQINEWENINNLEAVITGNGRDTFGLTYFATDYALNKEKYKTTKKLNIELSGIIYHLEISHIADSNTPDGPNFSPYFTMYMPNKEMSEFGCFDFIGILEDFRKVDVMDNRKSEGFILKVKLITNEDYPDFFTIEMFVNKQNMSFEDLTIGMQLTGLFQLQGQIKE